MSSEKLDTKEELIQKIKEWLKLDNDIIRLNKDLKEWLATYLKILWENLKKKTIPPYIHVWTYHMCEILEIYGNFE